MFTFKNLPFTSQKGLLTKKPDFGVTRQVLLNFRIVHWSGIIFIDTVKNNAGIVSRPMVIPHPSKYTWKFFGSGWCTGPRVSNLSFHQPLPTPAF